MAGAWKLDMHWIWLMMLRLTVAIGVPVTTLQRLLWLLQLLTAVTVITDMAALMAETGQWRQALGA